jgi:hypothetical protein
MIRCIVLADVHARPDLITNALKHADYNKDQDKLFFAGDFVDVGFKPIECWKLLQENNAIMLYGNHELAILLGQWVSWQDPYTKQLLHPILLENRSKFKVAAEHDGVLITHAGLSSSFGSRYLNENYSVSDISGDLNKNLSWDDLWQKDGPLWYRPTKYNKPFPNITQICGHTPPEAVLESFPDFHIIDPYITKGFENKNRYRYATIENGRVQVFDSKDKKR